MNLDDAAAVKALDTTLASIEAVMDVGKLRATIAELSEAASAPDLWNDQEQAQRVTSKLSHTQAELKRIQDLRQRLDDLSVLFELGEDEGGFPDVADLVGAGGDVLEYGPAGFQKGEASLSLGP